jgi:hypothetical protein
VDDAEAALAAIDDEAKLAETHDIGILGAARLRAAVAVLRRVLAALRAALKGGKR